MNKTLKRAIEKGLRGTGIGSVARTLRAGDFLVLAYHNIVPDGEPATGDLSLHLPQRELARQLDWIRRTHDVVPLSAILETRRVRGRPRAAITFDDAYRGAVTVGAGELADRGMCATIFVTPAFVGTDGFWWDRVAPVGRVTLPVEMRRYCLEMLEGRNDVILRWAREQELLVRSVPSHQSGASEAELRSCAASGNIAFASHTWSHPNLSRLGSAELQAEVERPRSWLSSRFSEIIPWLAYPYGLASPESIDAARAAGYTGAFLVDGGAVPPRDLESRRHALPRMNVPAGLSRDGFALRASGVFPRRRAALRDYGQASAAGAPTLAGDA